MLNFVAFGMLAYSLLLVGSADAQTREQALVSATIKAKPKQYAENGKFRGCGLNLLFIEDAFNKDLDFLSVSLIFYAEYPDGVAISFRGSRSEFKNQDKYGLPVPFGIASAWLRKIGEAPVELSGAHAKAGALTMLGSTNKVFPLIQELAKGAAKMQVGFKNADGGKEVAMVGVVNLENSDRDALAVCADELLESWRVGR